MIFIPLETMNYLMDEEGKIKHILVGFKIYHGEEQFNGRIYITQEYLDSVRDGLDIHNMSHAQIEVYARRKLKAWLDVTRPETGEEGSEEENE